MKALKWVILVLALLQGGWAAFDGSRALITGDYTTADPGPRAGRLGPWSQVVSKLGFEPRSTFIKCVHVVMGLARLAAFVVFLESPARGWRVMLVCAVASLWYLPIGTLFSLVIIALLMTPPMRSLK